MLIASIKPTVQHAEEIAKSPHVDGLRFNTVEPTPWSEHETLERLKDMCGEKDLWIDLKTRQLRVVRWADPEYDVVELSHSIDVPLPVKLQFKGHEAVITDIVDGNKLILDEVPPWPVGPGQPVNIQHPELKIDGFLTERDERYIEAGEDLDLSNYMLSFVEQKEDIDEVLELAPKANIAAKIESPKGLSFVTGVYPGMEEQVRLVAARDDLFINIGPNKVRMLEAERTILAHDPGAIAASRILTSLEKGGDVSLADLKDLQDLFIIGYRNLMLSDGLCKDAEAFRKAKEVYGQFLEYLQRWNDV